MKHFGEICLIWIIAVAFFLPGVCAQEQTRFGAVGLAVSTTDTQSALGWAAIAIPISDRLYSFTDTDVCVTGQSLQRLMNNQGLQYSIRTGFAVRMFDITPRLSVFSLGDAGIAAGGPGGLEGQTPVSGSFAGGGFVHWKFSDKIGALLILQVSKNAATGREFIPRVGVRVKL